MPSFEMLFNLPISFMNGCASIDDHRDQVTLLAIESPYPDLSATAVHGPAKSSCNLTSSRPPSQLTTNNKFKVDDPGDCCPKAKLSC
jgi:hypothetical protein